MTSSANGSAASSPACSPRIPIVPVRYAVLPGKPGVKAYAYESSGYSLSRDLPPLKEASYTLRALRPGYVYVYMKGKGGDKLVIHEYDGEGKYRELTYTGLENYHKRDAYRDGGSSHWVWAETTASEVWIGYSTHLWTNAITRQVTGSAAMRKRLMQPLHMDELTSGEKQPSKQKHVLPASALSTWVEDYKPKAQRVPLGWSACSVKEELPLSGILAQAGNYPATQPRVPAVVALYDAEGLTLELGLTVAAVQHQALDLKNSMLASKDKDDASALPACMRLDVEKVQRASADFHRKNVVAFLLDQSLRGMYKGGNTPGSRDPDSLAQLRRETYRVQYAGRRNPTDSELKYEVLTDKNLSPDGSRFAKRINYTEYKKFLAERDHAEQQLKQLLDRLAAACANHDVWLGTAEIANLEKPYSLAAALSSYDRDHKVAAQGLEQTIALCMHNMGNCLLIEDAKDPRFGRLQAWVKDKNSPIYMALMAYNEFKKAVEKVESQFAQKNDVKGTLLGASAAVINELGAAFEDVSGATDLIAETTSKVLMKRLNGKTRWDKSRTLRQKVEAAAREASMEDIVGLLGVRYRQTDAMPAPEAKFTGEVQELIDTGMARMVELKSSAPVRINTGSRTVTLAETKTLTIRPTLAGFSKTGAISALNFGAVYFNWINLASAFKDVTTNWSGENATNFASALFGTFGSLGAAMVSARAAYVVTITTIASRLPGVGYRLAAKTFLSSVAFTRLTGYPAIIAGLATDIQKGSRLGSAGNREAATYTYVGGAAMAIGGGLVLEGGIGLAGGAALIPVVGWGAAIVILIGAATIAGALWLYALAEAENNRPMEQWVTRSIFGNRMGDESSKNEVDYRPEAFTSLDEELQGWYQAYYGPLLLNGDAARQLGWDGVDSTWQGHWFDNNTAEFTVLLPGYVLGQSMWDGELTVPPRPGERIPLATYSNIVPETRITPHGLIVHYPRIAPRGDRNLQLRLGYHPNQGLSEQAEVSASFVLAG
ncbi:T6SS effector BTH_I2691 family protein [Paraburkholderia tropica]|uniref:T6SS effector BTH_I2691 family protein n=1 Tax=Paraburkholderia tropica TaxID=92647 RepID=UPI002ABD5AA7|nr:T6SS effector BTH_I2691 family protein [Paraburkholderia tropica]